MSNSASTAAELTAQTAATGAPATGGFFRHHGIWAPGVRLFRRLSFGAKAIILISVMVGPLLGVIGWMGWNTGGMGTVPAAVVAGALVMGAYLFRCFFLVMKGGLREVSAHLKAMTDGDLTTGPKPWGADEAASLMLDLSTMQQSLRRIVTQVRDASQNLSTVSDEIAAAAMDLSSRTEQSASHLERSNSAMAGIASTVGSVSQNTAQAATLAEHNTQIAQRGSTVIQQAVASMDGIAASSRQITEIIAVIDGIAFQTNILALNAAVEAARAGEQGRGFAVVAGEVRSLAGRSAEAAKQVRQLITGSVDQVRTGTEVVKDAGRIMAEIVDSAGTVRTLLAEISQASADNSEALARIGEAIHDIDQMTQQNAALVEETAASASGMKTRSSELSTAVAAFKLSSDANGMARKRLSEEVTASPQITIPELARLKSAGYKSIICNRPDGEGPGQTRFADIEKAARELGLQARHLPIEPGKASAADGQAFAQLLRELPKPVLAYCRTGMRSSTLWKMAHPGAKPLEG